MELTPPPAAIAYAWRQLAARAGVVAAPRPGDVLAAPTDGGSPNLATGFERLGLGVHYAPPERVPAGSPGIIVTPCRPSAWSELSARRPGTLDWRPAAAVAPPGARLPFEGSIPVLCWGAGADAGRPFAEIREDGALVFHVDIVAAALLMLARWEEIASPVRDAHDRFPGHASAAYRQGFLDRPVVDWYGHVLGAWIGALRPGWEPIASHFHVQLSHDIDHLQPFRPWTSALRALGGDIVRRRALGLAARTARDIVFQAAAPGQTSYVRGVHTLRDLAERHGFAGDAYYFMTARPGPMDNDYDVASTLPRRVIEALAASGAEVGLHASYHTLGDPDRLMTEKARLDTVLGVGTSARYGGRQHFLRFRVPETWRHWEAAGLAYDSTLGYADQPGFRCGTCHPFRPFDLEQDREMALWEVPLVAMDTTLRHYRTLAPDEGVAVVLALARRCREVGGTFTLLWHNSSLSGAWAPWGEAYRAMLRGLAETT